MKTVIFRTILSFVIAFLAAASLDLLSPYYSYGQSVQDFVTVKGISFNREVKSEHGTILELNGIGFRRVTIFRINVYAAALYATVPSESAEELIEHSGERQIHIRFMRDVGKDDIQEAFVENFKDNNPNHKYEKNLNNIAPHLPAVKKDDSMTLYFSEDGVKLNINDKTVGIDTDVEFGRSVLRIWLGENPPNSTLKSGLLKLDQ